MTIKTTEKTIPKDIIKDAIIIEETGEETGEKTKNQELIALLTDFSKLCQEFLKLLATYQGDVAKDAKNHFKTNTEKKQTKKPENNGFPMPNLSNLFGGMGNLGNLGGLSGISGLGGNNMPKSLEELKSNPQMMSMLKSLENNPSLLNTIASMSGMNSFRQESVPTRAEKKRADWSVWRPWWQEYWVDHGHWESDSWTDSAGKSHSSSYWVSNWVDEGWWEFDLNRYYASFSANMDITCDSKNPTATGSTMKSGYGINQKVSASVSTNQSSAISKPQNAVSYFPEFGYKTYWRLLERMGGGSFGFKKNNYSTYKNRTHFTPVWFPNGNYVVNTWVIDSWTPIGMLSANLTDTLNIKGSVWDDWHIGPLNP